MGEEICTDSCPSICSEKRTVARERSSRATVSFEEQIMSKDNYSCIFPKPEVVYCLDYPSNISSHSESSGAKQNYKTKTRGKIRRLSGAFWHCFLNTFPNFSTSKLKKNAPFRSLFTRRGLLAVSGHYRLITSANERTLLGHVSRFQQSRARENIWWIIRKYILNMRITDMQFSWYKIFHFLNLFKNREL